MSYGVRLIIRGTAECSARKTVGRKYPPPPPRRVLL